MAKLNVTTGKTWQESLDQFKTDADAYRRERERVTGLIDAGTAPDMAAAQRWLGQMDEVGSHHLKTVQQPPTAFSSMPSTQSYIDQLNEARRQATIADLGRSRDQALSGLRQERASVAPRYYDQRNIASAGAQQQARNFAEYMTARGGTSAGSNAQAQLMQNMSLQGNLGALGRQEQATYDDIDRRTSDIHSAYSSDVASAMANIEAARMQALIDQMNADRQFALQEGGLLGNYQGQRTLAGQQLDYGQQTDQRNFDYQVGRDEVADQRWQQEFELTKRSNELSNEAQRLNNELSRMQLENYPEEQRLRMQELQKRINEIGRAPQRSAQQIEMDNIALEQARLQLEQMKAQGNQSNAGFSQQEVNAYNALLAEYTKDNRDPIEAYEFASSPQGRLNAINFGLNEGLYNQMLSQLQSRLPQPQQSSTQENESYYVQMIDQIDPSMIPEFFESERAKIINDLGIQGFERLKSIYGLK